MNEIMKEETFLIVSCIVACDRGGCLNEARDAPGRWGGVVVLLLMLEVLAREGGTLANLAGGGAFVL